MAHRPKCAKCLQGAARHERREVEGKVYHNICFSCNVCNKLLDPDNYFEFESKLYCAAHFRSERKRSVTGGTPVLRRNTSKINGNMGSVSSTSECSPKQLAVTELSEATNTSADRFAERTAEGSESSAQSQPHTDTAAGGVTLRKRRHSQEAVSMTAQFYSPGSRPASRAYSSVQNTPETTPIIGRAPGGILRTPLSFDGNQARRSPCPAAPVLGRSLSARRVSTGDASWMDPDSLVSRIKQRAKDRDVMAHKEMALQRGDTGLIAEVTAQWESVAVPSRKRLSGNMEGDMDDMAETGLLCTACGLPIATAKLRTSFWVSNHVFHKRCTFCTKCHITLTTNNARVVSNKLMCEVHAIRTQNELIGQRLASASLFSDGGAVSNVSKDRKIPPLPPREIKGPVYTKGRELEVEDGMDPASTYDLMELEDADTSDMSRCTTPTAGDGSRWGNPFTPGRHGAEDIPSSPSAKFFNGKTRNSGSANGTSTQQGVGGPKKNAMPPTPAGTAAVESILKEIQGVLQPMIQASRSAPTTPTQKSAPKVPPSGGETGSLSTPANSGGAPGSAAAKDDALELAATHMAEIQDLVRRVLTHTPVVVRKSPPVMPLDAVARGDYGESPSPSNTTNSSNSDGGFEDIKPNEEPAGEDSTLESSPVETQITETVPAAAEEKEEETATAEGENENAQSEKEETEENENPEKEKEDSKTENESQECDNTVETQQQPVKESDSATTIVDRLKCVRVGSSSSSAAVPVLGAHTISSPSQYMSPADYMYLDEFVFPEVQTALKREGSRGPSNDRLTDEKSDPYFDASELPIERDDSAAANRSNATNTIDEDQPTCDPCDPESGSATDDAVSATGGEVLVVDVVSQRREIAQVCTITEAGWKGTCEEEETAGKSAEMECSGEHVVPVDSGVDQSELVKQLCEKIQSSNSSTDALAESESSHDIATNETEQTGVESSVDLGEDGGVVEGENGEGKGEEGADNIPARVKEPVSNSAERILWPDLIDIVEHTQDMTGAQHAQMVLEEMLTTERTYVKDLEEVITGYFEPLTKVMNLVELEVLFGNLRELLAFQRGFLESMEAANYDKAIIGKLFAEKESDLYHLYAQYCNNTGNSEKFLRERDHLQVFQAYLMSCKERIGHNLPLATYLLKPVQRVLRYPMLLKEILKYSGTEEEECVKALAVAERVAAEVNESKRRSERMEAVARFKRGIIGILNINFAAFGPLLKLGRLRSSKRTDLVKHERVMAVFRHRILLCKVERNDKYSVKESISVASIITVLELADSTSIELQVTNENKKKVFVLVASSPEDKEEWLQAFGAAIQATSDAQEVASHISHSSHLSNDPMERTISAPYLPGLIPSTLTATPEVEENLPPTSSVPNLQHSPGADGLETQHSDIEQKFKNRKKRSSMSNWVKSIYGNKKEDAPQEFIQVIQTPTAEPGTTTSPEDAEKITQLCTDLVATLEKSGNEELAQRGKALQETLAMINVQTGASLESASSQALPADRTCSAPNSSSPVRARSRTSMWGTINRRLSSSSQGGIPTDISPGSLRYKDPKHKESAQSLTVGPSATTPNIPAGEGGGTVAASPVLQHSEKETRRLSLSEFLGLSAAKKRESTVIEVPYP